MKRFRTGVVADVCRLIMLRAIILFSIYISACYDNADCITSSGISIFADNAVMKLHTCEEWESTTKQFIEDFSFYAQSIHYALPPSRVASSIYGITVQVITKSFSCDAPKGCSGRANLDMQHIDLAIHPELCRLFPEDTTCQLCDPNYSAYFHELSHFIMCKDLYMCLGKDKGYYHDHPLMHFEKSYFNTCGYTK
jgi:hypothetical protein